METSKTIGDFAPELPRPAVVCTIVKVTGSAPQGVGVRMWIAGNRVSGTLGGGEFERRVMEYARELLDGELKTAHIKEYVLCKEMGQCCGGRVEVFFEPVPRRRAIHLFGGGHIGRAVANVLSQTPFELHLIDPRPQWSSREGLPVDVTAHCSDPLEYAKLKAWSGVDAVCIFTHSHDLDYSLVRFFLPKPVGYLGLIGSDHKATVFQARLASEPLPGDSSWQDLWDEKMHCPIGLPLDGKNPKVIAVAVAAELMQKWGAGVRRERV